MTIAKEAGMTGGICFVLDARAPRGSSIFRKHRNNTRLFPPFRHPSGETSKTQLWGDGYEGFGAFVKSIMKMRVHSLEQLFRPGALLGTQDLVVDPRFDAFLL